MNQFNSMCKNKKAQWNLKDLPNFLDILQYHLETEEVLQ